MNNDFRNDYSDYLMHYGVKGMKWDKHIYAKKDERDRDGKVNNYLNNEQYEKRWNKEKYYREQTGQPNVTGTSLSPSKNRPSNISGVSKVKEDHQPVRPGRPGRQTGYQNTSNAVQMIQNVSRDGLGNTVLQDAAARIPHFQPVGGPVNISNGKKKLKAKSTVNQRDQENNKREVAREIHQMAKKNNQGKKDAVDHFVNQFIQNSQHQRENPLGNAAGQFMQNSQHHHQNANPVLDLVQGKKRRKKQGR